VCDALAAAEPYKEQLMRRGVLVVPLPIFNDSSSSISGSSGSDGSSSSDIPPPGREDLRWRVTAINPDGWCVRVCARVGLRCCLPVHARPAQLPTSTLSRVRMSMQARLV
jgi:hypothetical protein